MRVGEAVEIARVIRKMRGRSEAFLVQGCDGYFYVAKFASNPRGNRTLINEFIAAKLLSALEVKTPHVTVLTLTASCENRDQLYFYTAQRSRAIPDGPALGSRCPADPSVSLIFDFLPRKFYPRIANLDDVGVVFAFDVWSGHAETRQFVFTGKADVAGRTHLDELTAWPVDNGSCFGGKSWCEQEDLQRPNSQFSLYSHCDLVRTAANGARLIERLPASLIYSSRFGISPNWIEQGDEEALATMLQVLEQRKRQLVGQIEALCLMQGNIRHRRIA